MTGRGLLRSPAFAAALSFVVPGLGQALHRAYRRGILVALPAVGMGLWALWIGPRGFTRGAMTSTQFLDALLVVDLAALVYHLWAVVDAYRIARHANDLALEHDPEPGPIAIASIRRDPSPRSRTPMEALLAPRTRGVLGTAALLAVVVATVGTHSYVAANDVAARQALRDMFDPLGPTWARATIPPNYTLPPDDGNIDWGGPAPTNARVATPNPDISFSTRYPVGDLPQSVDLATDWRADGKLNVLLIGVDQGCTAGPSGDRMYGLRTDTMILLEVDMDTGRSAMFGIPRNMKNVPLPRESAIHYAGGGYPEMLNSLWLEAVNKGAWFPYYQDNYYLRGIKALEGAVGTLTGLRVDGTVLVNLMGFVYIVDAIHGIDVDLPEAFLDKPDPGRTYMGAPDPYNGYMAPDCSGYVSYDWPVGVRHLNGFDALAYARARGQTWDYTRMERQQVVLKAIRDKVNPCSLSVGDVYGLINALGQAFWTDMPQSDLPDFIGLASHVGSGNIKNITFTPWTIGTADETVTTVGWQNIKYLVAHALDDVPSGTDGGAGGSGGILHC